jgi:hypothetical protein
MINQLVSMNVIDTLKEQTLLMTNGDFDRQSYLKIFDLIKNTLGPDSAAVFRDNVQGENDQFWINEKDYGYMWKRILKLSK